MAQARDVAVYLAAGTELDTAPLIAALHRAGKRVWVPGLGARPGRMRMLRLLPDAPLRSRRFGLREPVRRRPQACRTAPTVVILPLVGFDRCGTRLGSGGGYYDRWLARQRPRPFCVGFAYALQELSAPLMREPWDQPLDAVCTERGRRRFARR